MVGTTTRLPRTTRLNRRPARRTWWLAAGVAGAVNLGLIVLLAEISQLAPEVPAPPLAVTTIRRLPEEPPPPPPPPVAEVPAVIAQPAVELALPSLDLAVAEVPGAFSLPAVGTLADQAPLAVAIPAFAVAAPVSGGGEALGGGAELPVDRPAEREGAFDLDRFYPRAARAKGLTGSSTIRLDIDASGAVTAVNVLRSEPAGVFDHAAERLGRSLQFRPAQRAGHATATRQEITIAWSLR
jgi:protein TonB